MKNIRKKKKREMERETENETKQVTEKGPTLTVDELK
jgi:hypothetical protein